jgi:spore germination protein
MRIHTVKEGDTIFKIARSYAVAPAKIIENNALSSPDRLYPGQKLIILTPTRTYTVRGGDTLESIALRFGADTEELMRNNPSLMGGDKIYPGQILAIKYGETDYGNAVVNGYARRGTARDKLDLFLPYLTYLTIASHKWENGELCRVFAYQEILKIAEMRGVLPIMRIYINDSQKELLEKGTGFIEDLVGTCKDEGFFGFAISGAPLKERGFEAILRKLKKEAQESNLELHMD